MNQNNNKPKNMKPHIRKITNTIISLIAIRTITNTEDNLKEYQEDIKNTEADLIEQLAMMKIVGNRITAIEKILKNNNLTNQQIEEQIEQILKTKYKLL